MFKSKAFYVMFMIILLFSIGKEVYAESFVEWDPKSNIAKDKKWTVTFSDTVDSTTINKNTVYISYEDNINEKHPVKLEVSDNKVTVIPLIDYNFDTKYVLNIKGIISTKGISLNDPIKMSFFTEPNPDEVIVFADPQIEFAVRVKIGKEYGDILKSEVLKITDLVIEWKGISDLTGLEHLENLESLYLHYNNISDLTPLRNLGKLERLGLYDNNVSNLEPLRNLTNLTNLYLGKNEIVDLKPLMSLDKLDYLDVNKNSIQNIHPIMKISSLRTFVVFGNDLNSFEQQTLLQNLRDRGMAVAY